MRKMILAAWSVVVLSGCVAPINMDDLFDNDATPLTATPDAGHDAAPVAPVAPAVVPDAGTPEQPGNDTCWAASWIQGPGVGTYDGCTSKGGIVIICPTDTAMADNCVGPIPWEGSVTIQWSQPRCCH